MLTVTWTLIIYAAGVITGVVVLACLANGSLTDRDMEIADLRNQLHQRYHAQGGAR